MKKALIAGIIGQDESYLAELLLEKGYEAHGMIRRSSSFNTGRIDHPYKDPHVKRGNTFFLSNSNTSPDANIVFSFGRANDVPIIGLWN